MIQKGDIVRLIELPMNYKDRYSIGKLYVVEQFNPTATFGTTEREPGLKLRPLSGQFPDGTKVGGEMKASRVEKIN